MNTGHKNLPPEELQALAGEYVLGTLSATERHEIEQRMPKDYALRSAVAQWQDRLLPLAQVPPAVPPSAYLWARIERSLNQQTSATPAPATCIGTKNAPHANTTRWWNRLGLWRGLSATGFAMAAVLAAVLVTSLRAPTPSPQYMVVLVAPKDKSPGWVAQTSNHQEIQLIPLGNTQVPANRTLELWTKADGWSGPASLGLVQPGQPVQIPLSQLPPLQPNQLFELTLEPAKGSPTGKPTGPIQFIGRAVKVL